MVIQSLSNTNLLQLFALLVLTTASTLLLVMHLLNSALKLTCVRLIRTDRLPQYFSLSSSFPTRQPASLPLFSPLQKTANACTLVSHTIPLHFLAFHFVVEIETYGTLLYVDINQPIATDRNNRTHNIYYHSRNQMLYKGRRTESIGFDRERGKGRVEKGMK